MTIEDKIRKKLELHLNISLLEVVNESPRHQVPEGAETHFRVLIISSDFNDLSTVQRHQKVYQILADELKGPVHAFSQKTMTPEEWRGMDSSLSPSPPCQKKSHLP